jgi:hypothetical protein
MHEGRGEKERIHEGNGTVEGKHRTRRKVSVQEEQDGKGVQGFQSERRRQINSLDFFPGWS